MPKVRIVTSENPNWKGYRFKCPGCNEYHIPDNTWYFNGDVEKPTFSPSILVNNKGQYHNPAVPTCHSFVRDGKIEFLPDCTHELAGKTVDLPELREAKHDA